jgi:hypothetical protein
MFTLMKSTLPIVKEESHTDSFRVKKNKNECTPKHIL